MITKTVNSKDEKKKRRLLKQEKPYVYEKVLKFKDKIKRGESTAIIQMQYNYACNMACQHCSIKCIQQQKGENRRVLTPEVVKEIARQADEMGLARFEINGGEPLVNKDLDEVIKAIDPQKFYINNVTNGWLLDDNRAKHLKAMGVDRIQVSVDNLNAKDHDNFRRRKGSHARAHRADEASRKAGLAVFVSTLVTKQRLYSAEFMDFIKYFNDRDIGVFMTFAKPVGAWEGKFDMLIDKKDLAYVRDLETKHKIFSHLTPSYGCNLGCPAVKGLFAISQYGDILPCQYIFISLGNIFKQSLKEIIQTGLNIKYFGEHVDTCPIAIDRNFINNYIAKKTYGKPLPVPWYEVFTDKDKTQKPFNKDI